MSWIDSQRFLRIARVVRGVGWTVFALCIVFTIVAVINREGDDVLHAVTFLAAVAAVAVAVTHAVAWRIEKHAERVVVR